MKRHFLSLADISTQELFDILTLAESLKSGNSQQPLLGKSVALIFQKPSLRTRVSFEVGVYELGGHPVVLGQESIGIGKRESIEDVAKTLSRYVDIIVARVFEHSLLEGFVTHGSACVINALSDLSHPCQILADLLTLKEKNKLFEGVNVAYVGDGNNVTNSWLEAASLYPLNLTVVCPKGYEPNKGMVALAKQKGKGNIVITDDTSFVKGADVIYTDVWTSMGQEAETEQRKEIFKPYQVNKALVSQAKADAIVMHCLPAHEGEEITSEVLKGNASVVFDEAENRLHAQKALLAKLSEWNTLSEGRRK